MTDMADGMPSWVSELRDRNEITEVLYLYARGWDRSDVAALEACFHQDSQHSHGGFEGTSLDFIKAGFAMCTNVKAMSHLITNPMIRINGDVAVSECSFLAHHRRTVDGQDEDMFLKGRYIDRFERRAGNWRIARRIAVHDFERVVPPADQTIAGAPPEQLSQPKPHDPIYQMLAAL